MVKSDEPRMIWRNRKIFSALLPYALILERRDQREMLNVLSHAAMIASSFFEWNHIKPFIVSKGNVQYIQQVRALGDPEVLKSYLLLFWSGLSFIDNWLESLTEVQISIQEDFGGIRMGSHREDLIKWLDHGLAHLDHAEQVTYVIQPAKERYEEFRRLLLEEDVKMLSRTPL